MIEIVRVAGAITLAVMSGCGFHTPASTTDDAPRTGDGGPTDPDADPDAPAADAPVDGPTPCSNPAVLIGTNDQTGSTPDNVPSNIADAFGFTTSVIGTARCAWVYVGTAPTGAISFGVYSNLANDSPGTRLATAAIPHPTMSGWVSAPLDVPVTVATGDTLWLALITTGGTLVIPSQSACSTRLKLHSNFSVSALPVTFTTTNTFVACDAALYLSR